MEVLAKVVFPSYNKDVHAHLAAQHIAPQLYGTSDLHDLASMAVMELLKDDWTTLFHYRKICTGVLASQKIAGSVY